MNRGQVLVKHVTLVKHWSIKVTLVKHWSSTSRWSSSKHVTLVKYWSSTSRWSSAGQARHAGQTRVNQSHSGQTLVKHITLVK